MTDLEIDNSTPQTILQSFDKIAERLFNDFQLQINKSFYRLIDIEFYYFSSNNYEDIYSHKHDAQLQKGKWYFHGSGIDITFGNGTDHGGILIRSIVKLSNKVSEERNFIEKEVHGPLNVKTEICSNLYGAFENSPNTFQFNDISENRMSKLMKGARHIIKTKRIGLNSAKESIPNFHLAKLRYVIFPYLKHRDKTEIALDMRQQFPEMTVAEINQQFGSTFLKG